jgi:hypothetical protein
LRQAIVERLAHAVEQAAGIFGHVPLVDRDDQGAAFFQHHRGDLEILVLQPARGIEQQHDHFGKVDGAARIGDRELFQLVDHLRLLAHAGGVDQAIGRASPSLGSVQLQSMAIESRVMPASGPVSRRSSPRSG